MGPQGVLDGNNANVLIVGGVSGANLHFAVDEESRGAGLVDAGRGWRNESLRLQPRSGAGPQGHAKQGQIDAAGVGGPNDQRAT